MVPKSTPSSGNETIVDAVLTLVATDGLEAATVRRVASGARVSIGTVQHYFPTKDAMIVAAFAHVVDRIRSRVAGLRFSQDVRADLRAVAAELLPLDARRQREVRIQLAFAASAASSPELARRQRAVLGDVRRAIADGFARVWPDDDERCQGAAAALLALVDGVAVHAVSSRVRPTTQLLDPVELLLDALLAG